MSDELAVKACPFCGGCAEHSEYRHQVWCSRCFVETIEHDATQKAIAAWNRRVVTGEQYDEMVYELHSECRDLNYKQARAATEAMLRASGFEVAE